MASTLDSNEPPPCYFLLLVPWLNLATPGSGPCVSPCGFVNGLCRARGTRYSNPSLHVSFRSILFIPTGFPQLYSSFFQLRRQLFVYKHTPLLLSTVLSVLPLAIAALHKSLDNISIPLSLSITQTKSTVYAILENTSSYNMFIKSLVTVAFAAMALLQLGSASPIGKSPDTIYLVMLF